MEVNGSINEVNFNASPKKVNMGKAILCIGLAMLPIAAAAVMTFMNFPFNGLITFGVGTGIGLMLIPFMLVITSTDKWTKKWYIWVGMILTILIVLVLPMFKSNSGGLGMPMPPGGDMMMGKPMY